MCTPEDYQKLKIIPKYRKMLEEELPLWHDFYLPLKSKGCTVLDVGAGCGETAQFYLNHGAGKVIAIECDKEAYRCLCDNFKNDKRVIPIFAEINHMKIDVDGAEEDMALEVHFPYKLRKFRGGFKKGSLDEYQLLKFERNKGVSGKIANLYNISILGVRKLMQGDLRYKKSKE